MTVADAAYEIQRLGWLFREAADYGTLVDFYGAVHDLLVRELGADPRDRAGYVDSNTPYTQQECRVGGLMDLFGGVGWKLWYNPSDLCPFSVDYYREMGSRQTEKTRLRVDSLLADLYASWKGDKPRGGVNIRVA